MNKLRIKNFGSIKQGFTENDGIMTISPVTFIIGNQATGKSTVAKVYSLFVWLEKALIKGTYENKGLEDEDFLYLFENHKIKHYFQKDSVLEFWGQCYHFIYSDSHINVEWIDGNKEVNYNRPKIMYVPSERNLFAVLDSAENVRNLPEVLNVFFERYRQALKSSKNGEFPLPISNIKLYFDQKTLQTTVNLNNSSLPIEEASSGIQSAAPLSVVTNYLANEFSSNFSNLLESIKKLGYKERADLKAAIKKDIENNVVSSLVETSFNDFLASGKDDNSMLSPYIETKLRYLFNTCFINIVEEPEQNLFPSSQKKVLYELLSCFNKTENNQLLITTHSPYMLSYLTLAIKAGELKNNGFPVDKIEKIVPVEACVSGDKCCVFETNEDGSINLLDAYGSGMPSDKNFLNKYLIETNTDFDRLLDIQDM